MGCKQYPDNTYSFTYNYSPINLRLSSQSENDLSRDTHPFIINQLKTLDLSSSNTLSMEKTPFLKTSSFLLL